MSKDVIISNNEIPFPPACAPERLRARLRHRHAAERRFRLYGLAAVGPALMMLVLLFVAIVAKGYPAFRENVITLTIPLTPATIDPEGRRDPQTLAAADYQGLVKAAMASLFPAVAGRTKRRLLFDLVSTGASYQLHTLVVKKPDRIGTTVTLEVPLSDEADQFLKGHMSADTPEADRRIKDQQVAWLKDLESRGLIRNRFNTTLFTSGDSREPELAGILGAVVGSFYLILTTLLLSFPTGVAAAVYLEEFAPRNRLTDWIEVNINNLAAVPSVVFGLLGLATFLNTLGLPRSAPFVGGLVLSLIILPTIIIAARAALKSVPPSIREAALGVGASKMQSVLHHVLPLAMPGIMTGTIIGMAHALGESAPLLMIGMVAFIVDIPSTPLDPATVLPVQVYLWSNSPERAFVERTSAAIMVLLVFLIVVNALAVILRKKFERQW